MSCGALAWRTVISLATRGTKMNNTHKNQKLSRSEQRRREWSRRPAKRRMAFMPLPGEPGGRDDPYRAGLSGCAVKWYLRFLKRGLPPKKARAMAVDPNRKMLEESLKYTDANSPRSRDSSEERIEEINVTSESTQDRLSENKKGLTDSEKDLFTSYIAQHFEPEEARGKVMHQRLVKDQNRLRNEITTSDQRIDMTTDKYNEKAHSQNEVNNKLNVPNQSRAEVAHIKTLSKEEPKNKHTDSFLTVGTTASDETSEKDLEMYCQKHGLTGAERVRFLECMKKNRELKYAPSKDNLSFQSCIDPRNKGASSLSGDEEIGLVPRKAEARFCKENKIQGSSRKWYMRFRRQGYSIEEAHKKLMERKVLRQRLELSREEQRKIFVWKNADSSTEASTSKAASSFPSRNVQPLLNSPPPTDRSTQMAILPQDYPKYTLTKEDLAALESAIIAEVKHGSWNVNVVFRDITFGPGLLLIDCENIDTAKWLAYVVPQLHGWRGVTLKACLKENLPNPHSVTMYLPNSVGQDISAIFAQIGVQNNGLYVSEWKLINVNASGRDQTIVFSVDHGSWETICKNNGVVRYGYGMIRLEKKY